MRDIYLKHIAAGVVCLAGVAAGIVTVLSLPLFAAGGLAALWTMFFAVLICASLLAIYTAKDARAVLRLVGVIGGYVLVVTGLLFGIYTRAVTFEFVFLFLIIQFAWVAGMLVVVWRTRKTAGILLLPVLGWMLFMGYWQWPSSEWLKYFRLKNVRIISCVYSYGGYSEQSKALIPDLDSWNAKIRMMAIERYGFQGNLDEVQMFREAAKDPCRQIGKLAVGKVVEAKADDIDLVLDVFGSSIDSLPEIFYAVVDSRVKEKAKANKRLKELILKALAPGNPLTVRYAAFSAMAQLEFPEGRDILFSTMRGPSPEMRRTAAQYIERYCLPDDQEMPQKLMELYAESSDKDVKSRIEFVMANKLRQKPAPTADGAGPGAVAAAAVDTQQVPLQALSYPVEGSSTTIMFGMPVGGSTKSYIEMHYSRELKELTPELKQKLEDELRPYTAKGDRYLVGIGKGRWIKGTLTDFTAISPACGGFVVGVLSVDSPEEREMLAEVSKWELFVKKDVNETLREGIPSPFVGILDVKVSDKDKKDVEAALGGYLSEHFKDWKTKKQETAASLEDFRELVQLANLDVELRYELAPVDLGQGNEGFIVTAGWGKGTECYAALFAFLRKVGDGYGVVPINFHRGLPGDRDGPERPRFEDYSLVGSLSNVIDYNGDGLGDIINSVFGYESFGYSLQEFNGQEFKETGIGYGLGC